MFEKQLDIALVLRVRVLTVSLVHIYGTLSFYALVPWYPRHGRDRIQFIEASFEGNAFFHPNDGKRNRFVCSENETKKRNFRLKFQ